MKYYFSITAIALVFLTGCTTIGPQTVPRDRFDYNTAIADSWKEQTLLNIVKLRYADMPLFVEVASVVSGYTLESGVSLGGSISSKNAVQGDFFDFGTSGKFTDRPTITYAPITGDKFNESFMTPIPPKLILFMLQSGWKSEMMFPIVLEAVNGLRSGMLTGKLDDRGDLGYYRMIELMQIIQESGNVSMRVKKSKEGKETTVLFFYRDRLPPEIHAAIKELEELLGLRPGLNELNVTYGIIPETDQELTMQTRSMLQIMIAMATQIDVPPGHVEDGRTVPSLTRPGVQQTSSGKLVSISTPRNTSPTTPLSLSSTGIIGSGSTIGIISRNGLSRF